MRKVFFVLVFLFTVFFVYGEYPDFKYSRIVLADVYVPSIGEFVVSYGLNENNQQILYILDEVDLGPGEETGVCWSEGSGNDMWPSRFGIIILRTKCELGSAYTDPQGCPPYNSTCTPTSIHNFARIKKLQGMCENTVVEGCLSKTGLTWDAPTGWSVEELSIPS